MVRCLVEDSLTGKEKAQAERNLLSCEACLEEYNWYSDVWESMTDRQAFDRWTTHLNEKDPERYQLYSRAVEKLSEYGAEKGTHQPDVKSGYWFSAPRWRSLAFALSAIVLVGLPLSTYKVVKLQRAVKSQEAYYQKLLHEKEDQRMREAPQVGALNKKVTALTTQAQQQAEKIDELSQALEKYVKPSANAVLSRPFFTIRQSQVQEIEFPKGKLFLNLHIRAAEDKEYKIYSVIIKESSGKTLWQDDRVLKDENGNFDLLIAKSFLKPGDYVLEIYGLARGQRDLISQTRFHIK